ncbi:MAG TPA: ABC transporter ATP-binding protein [Alphaproteobacteria bacterium]|nr:ABC transporter ATP-binding protein [Alphaproteobacteria bacterium]
MLFLIFGAGVLTALTPLPFKYFIDSLSLDVGQRINFFSFLLPATLLVYGALFFLLRLIGEFQVFFYGLHEQKILNSMRLAYLRQLHQLPLSFHMDKKIGEKDEILSQTINALRTLFSAFFLIASPIFFEVTSILIMVSFLWGWSYLLVLFSCLVFYVFIMMKGANVLANHQRQNREILIQSRGLAGDCLVNIETTKIFAGEQYFEEKYSSLLNKTDETTTTFFRKRITIGIAQIILLTIGLLAINSFSSIDYQQGLVTIGTVILINTYLLQLFRPLERMNFSYREVRNASVSLEKTAFLFQEIPEKSGSKKLEDNHNPLSIQFQDVAVSYSGKPVLQDISFSLEAGKVLGIAGETGSGKTTLIRLILGLVQPDLGKIVINRNFVEELNLIQLRQEIAVVPQQPLLFHDTLYENLRFVKTDATMEEIEHALEIASLKPFIQSLPKGLDTKVGEMGMKLSGGERQRLAIARAILKMPRLFIFDEATSSLDRQTEADLLQNIKNITHKITTIIISHRLPSLIEADEILVLRHGRIIERGTHASLMQLGGYYQELWTR